MNGKLPGAVSGQPLAVTITPAVEPDIRLLELLVNSAYRGESSKKGWTTEADLLEGLRTDADALQAMIRQPDSIILCAWAEGGLLAGCVHLHRQGDLLYLGMLSVVPEGQARGIGKHLLRAAEFHATSLGLKRIQMTVISQRRELIGWYERHGYRPTGETRPFPADTRFGLPKQPLEFCVLEKYLP